MMGNKGFSLVEMVIVVLLMGLATMAVVAIMNSINSNVLDAQNRMNLSTFGMELKQHLRKQNSNGIGYCMVHPVIAGTKFSPKSLGQVLNDTGSSRLSVLVQTAKVKPGDAGTFIDTGKIIPFSGEELYGGSGTDKSADFMTLLNSRIHSFVIRKIIRAYVVPAPQAIVVATTPKREYLYLVSAIYENSFVRGLPPTSAANIEPSKIINSKIQVNFVIRNVNGNYAVIDCGTTNLVKTTAFVESCRALGADFEYVVDRPATFAGQCYAPEYYLPAGAIATGQTPGVLGSYIPLRSYLCEGAMAGKSLNMPFCTGIY